MRKDKLEKLADFLEKLPLKGFDMGVWRVDASDALKCDTTACAWGWTPIVFPEEKFRYKICGFESKEKQVYYDGNCGYEGAASFFDLTFSQSCSIFDFDEYAIPSDEITPWMVSERIREIIREYEAKSIDNYGTGPGQRDIR